MSSIFNIFNGGWSYTNLEMTALFKIIDINKEYDNYNILEFGGGDSSNKIYNLFKNVKNLHYVLFGSNTNYLPSNNEIFDIKIYNENTIENIDFQYYVSNELKFDLILIDGPNGDKRKYWYNKIKNNVKIGTIILIDDFNHYISFSEELDRNYEYELLSYLDIPFIAGGEHSWKIVRVKNIK